MAKVYPFRGLRYAPERGALDRVLTQPYDKISQEMQDRYYALDPHNIVRIVFGKQNPGDSPEDNVYTRAAACLQEWKRTGVLAPLTAPAFLVYFQRFKIPGTEDELLRKGFVGLGRLEDYADKVVFPHELTLSGPVEDRLQLLRHTRTHFEQIFMLYEDPAQAIDRVLERAAAAAPAMDVTDEYGVRHTLWIIDDAAAVQRIQQEMEAKKLLIADGHHRYKTALAYRDEMRAASGLDPDAAHERLPMTFFNMHSPGLTILPTHRVVSGLDGINGISAAALIERASAFFDVAEADSDPAQFREALIAAGQGTIAIGFCGDSAQRNVILSLKPSADLQAAMPDLSAAQRALDVVVLHRLLVEKCLGIGADAVRKESHIRYLREFASAVDAVRTGAAQMAFLLNATRLDQLRDVAYEGNVMPQKSTDFYPKVLSGLIMYALDPL